MKHTEQMRHREQMTHTTPQAEKYRAVDALQVCQWNRQLFEQFAKGGLICVHVSIALWENTREALWQIGDWNRHFEEHADLIAPGRTREEIEQIADSGRTAIVLGFQNCSPFETDITLVQIFHQLGVRIAQLTYNMQNHIGSSCWEAHDSGLSRFGKSVVREMNRCGMVIDLSHCGDRTSLEAIKLSRRPVAITHANPASAFPLPRNTSDEILRALADNGGILGCTPYPTLMIDPKVKQMTTLHRWCEVVAGAVELMGIDHVGIGTDTCHGYTNGQMNAVARARHWSPHDPVEPGLEQRALELYRGGWKMGPAFQHQLVVTPYADFYQSSADFPNLAAGLREIGFSPEETAKIMGENWLRLFDDGFKSRAESR